MVVVKKIFIAALIPDGATNVPKVVVTPKQNGGALVHGPATSVSTGTSNGQGDPVGKPFTENLHRHAQVLCIHVKSRVIIEIWNCIIILSSISGFNSRRTSTIPGGNPIIILLLGR